MTKALVVNGLHRSGTNMLGRLIDSQPNMICMGNVFEMLKIIARMRDVGDKNNIIRESFTTGNNKITPKSYPHLRSALVGNFVAEIADVRWQSPFYSDGTGRVYGLSLAEIFEMTDVIVAHEPISDIASLLASIGEKLGVAVLGTKWNAAHNYAPEFLSSPNAYWLEIVRNPYATRASDELRHRNITWSNFKDHEDALRFASKFRHQRFHVVRYEELCNDTDNCLRKMSDWLGEEIKNVELVNPLGGKFYAMTTHRIRDEFDRPAGQAPRQRLGGQGSFYEVQDSTLDSRIGTLDLDRWRKTFTDKDIAFLNLAIDFHGLYEKEPASLPGRIYAYSRMARVMAYETLKSIVRGILKPLGIHITRTRPFGYAIHRAKKEIAL